MADTDQRRHSLYFPDDMLNEIMKEAIRLAQGVGLFEVATHQRMDTIHDP